jgi:hypothetical protein
VRRFSAWLAEECEQESDPLFGLKSPKLDTPITEPLTDDQLRAMLKACPGPDLRDKRDAAILTLMFTTGARAGEVVALQVANVRRTQSQPTCAPHVTSTSGALIQAAQPPNTTRGLGAVAAIHYWRRARNNAACANTVGWTHPTRRERHDHTSTCRRSDRPINLSVGRCCLPRRQAEMWRRWDQLRVAV